MLKCVLEGYQNDLTSEEINACIIEEAAGMWQCFEFECDAIMPDGTCLEGDCMETFEGESRFQNFILTFIELKINFFKNLFAFLYNFRHLASPVQLKYIWVTEINIFFKLT
jgi:hypothetical protein